MRKLNEYRSNFVLSKTNTWLIYVQFAVTKNGSGCIGNINHGVLDARAI
jgi:hypothetical protein